jgi:hypothetical protein
MSEIVKYALVDRNDQEGDHEYDTLPQAIKAAKRGHAVISRTYVYDDSELVWTPDGGDVWPPHK